MCLPRAYQQASSGDQSTGDDQNLGQGLVDLDTTREEVLKEVFIITSYFIFNNKKIIIIIKGFKYTTSS